MLLESIFSSMPLLNTILLIRLLLLLEWLFLFQLFLTFLSTFHLDVLSNYCYWTFLIGFIYIYFYFLFTRLFYLSFLRFLYIYCCFFLSFLCTTLSHSQYTNLLFSDYWCWLDNNYCSYCSTRNSCWDLFRNYTYYYEFLSIFYNHICWAVIVAVVSSEIKLPILGGSGTKNSWNCFIKFWISLLYFIRYYVYLYHMINI